MTDTIENAHNRPATLVEADRALQGNALLSPLDSDEQANQTLELPPSVRSMLAPLIAALRWCAVVLGTALTAADATDGDVGLVVTTSICLYLTTWRTMRPIRLGAQDRTQWIMGITDTALLGAAVGVNDGLLSPFAFCVAAAAAVAAFGWGVRHGLAALGGGVLAMGISSVISGGSLGLSSRAGWFVLATTVIIVGLLGVVRNRLVETEQRRAQLAGRIDALQKPTSCSMCSTEWLERSPRRSTSNRPSTPPVPSSRDTFKASVIGLLTLSEVNNTWSPLLAEGLAIPPTIAHDGIPDHLRAMLTPTSRFWWPTCHAAGWAQRRAAGSTPLSARGARSWAYWPSNTRPPVTTRARCPAARRRCRSTRLDHRQRALVPPTPHPGRRGRARPNRPRPPRPAGTVAHLYQLRARAHQVRVHATLGELDALHQDVQRAIDELRETLRQMRTTVTDSQPLAAVTADLVDAFRARTGINLEFSSDDQDDRLPVRSRTKSCGSCKKHSTTSTSTQTPLRWRSIGMSDRMPPACELSTTEMVSTNRVVFVRPRLVWWACENAPK